jgi:hypothetical protein
MKALREMRSAFFATSTNRETQEVTIEEAHSKGKILRRMIEGQREIARCDGRAQPNDLDRTRAHEQLIGATSGSRKLPTREERARLANVTCLDW